MLTNSESPHIDLFVNALDHNDECEFCGRSIIARFGGIPTNECDSCRADFDRVMKSSDGLIEFVSDDEVV